MTVFFLSASKNEAKKALLKILDIIVSKNKITIFEDANELEDRLRLPLSDKLMAVLLPADIGELTHIISLKVLFGDMPIILILPDRGKNTVTMGYKLRPRFITYADSDFLDVAAVLMKMKSKMEAGEDYL